MEKKNLKNIIIIAALTIVVAMSLLGCGPEKPSPTDNNKPSLSPADTVEFSPSPSATVAPVQTPSPTVDATSSATVTVPAGNTVDAVSSATVKGGEDEEDDD